MSKKNKRSQGKSKRKISQKHDPRGRPAIKVSGRPFPEIFSDELRAALRREAVVDVRTKFFYLIPHSQQRMDHASLVGWYTPGLHASASMLLHASILPADVRDLIVDQAHVLMNRLARLVWPQIIPVELSALREAQKNLPSPFQVFFSNDKLIAIEIDKIIQSSDFPCLHVSSVSGPSRIPPSQVSPEVLDRYVKQVINVKSDDLSWTKLASSLREIFRSSSIRSELEHELPRGLHNVVTPNENALEAFGWTLSKIHPIVGRGEAPSPQLYIGPICASADAVTAARLALLKKVNASPRYIDYRFIVAVPSFFWGLQGGWRSVLRKAEGEMKAAIKNVLPWILHGKSYFDEMVSRQVSLIKNPAFQILMQQRSADARCYTAGLSLLSTATLAPVLRLEPRLNEIRVNLNQLAGTVRSNGKHHLQWKLSRMTEVLGRKIRSLIDEEFLRRIDEVEASSRIEGLKLVSDLPLELMPSRNLILGLRFDVSRQIVMPGNLFLAGCARPPLIVSMGAISDILILRSFAAGDPLRDVLETAIEVVLPTIRQKINIKIIDVDSAEEFAAALNSFQGALMIYDGHGHYDRETGTGSLYLSTGRIDAWELRKSCQFPPIVIFSACDTQPLDGSHGSSATAAFTLGATTVLATTLPIAGTWAATFLARLLLRVAEFVPIAVDHKSHVSWREVISGLLRMTHVTETMFLLRRFAKLPITKSVFETVQMSANMKINQMHADWYESFVENLAKILDIEQDALVNEIKQWASITEAMKYVQLGAPENVIIVKSLDPKAVKAYMDNIHKEDTSD